MSNNHLNIKQKERGKKASTNWTKSACNGNPANEIINLLFKVPFLILPEQATSYKKQTQN